MKALDLAPATRPKRHPLAATVRRFGWISFANDLASEMVTPLIPLLLVGPLGASAVVVGVVEGLAEAACQALKWVAGRWSDRSGKHLASVFGGYALSNLVRPLIGLAAGPAGVAVLRTLDRVGKGLRTAPRDALLAHAVAAPDRGRAFGFQRSLDHLGAALGPLLAFAALEGGASLSAVILWSALPGALTLGLFLRFRPAPPQPAPSTPPLEWTDLDPVGHRLVIGAALLALANLPEALLVVWLHAAGFSVAEIVLIWAAAHVVKTTVAYPAGALADRHGRRRVVLWAWSVRAALLALGATGYLPPSGAPLAFLAYAATLAASEGAERALIAAAAPPARRGAAFGAYAALPGLAALPGGAAFGALWAAHGAEAAFAAGAVAALIGCGWLHGAPARAGA